jgi:hypothetical protein
MDTVIAIGVLVVVGYIGYLIVRKWRRDMLERIKEKKR